MLILKSKKIVVICVVILLILGSFGISLYFGNYLKSDLKSEVSQPIQVNVTILGPDSNQIYSGNVSLSSTSKYGITVLQALDETKINYKTNGNGDKLYVSEINNISSSGNSGWMFKVNNIMPMTGAPKCDLKNGDNVVWSYSSF